MFVAILCLLWKGLLFNLKRNEIGSSVETWVGLETVIQSEVSQKEKKNPNINSYIWNLENGTDDLICKTETET